MPIAYFSKELQKAGFRHAFSTRLASTEEIGEALRVAYERIRVVKQVHSARVVEAQDESLADEEADAIVSREDDAISIRTADCVPILIAAPESGAVAAIHAGWRGVVSGVVPNACEMLGSDRKNWIAAIGPCICGECFEVGVDVAEKIIGASNEMILTKRAIKDEEEKAFVDLRKAVRVQLIRAGISDSQIEDVAGCTYHQKDLFFSYRRDGANAGRLIAAIRPSSQSMRQRGP